MMKHYDRIMKHAEANYPRECCGLIIEIKGVSYWFPCENHATEPEEGFKFNSVEYIGIIMKADKILAIVHSHCDTNSDPSPHDINACNFLKIPYLIVGWPDKSITLINPGEYDA